MWNKFKKSMWFIPAITAVVVILAVSGVFAYTSLWQPTTIHNTGTVTVNTPVTSTYTYTVSSSNLDWGNLTYNAGDSVSVTSNPISVTNTGNQAITAWGITPSHLPSWLTATISQTAISAGGTGSVTITLTGTATNSFNFVGDMSHTITFSIVPNPQ